MRKTRLSRIGALVLAFAMLFALAGCGAETFDAAGYVDANLKVLTTGETTQLEKFKDVAVVDPDLDLDAELEEMTKSMMGDANLSESVAKDFKDVMKQLVGNISYTVGEATEVTEGSNAGSYDVELKIKPLQLNIAKPMSEWISGLDYSKFDMSDTDALYETLYTEVIRMIKEAADKKEYGEEKTYTIHVEKNKDGLYDMDGNVMEEVGNNLFTTDMDQLMS